MFKLYIMEIGEILKNLVLYPIYKIEVFRLKRIIKRNEKM